MEARRMNKITFWNGDPNNGGKKIPGELVRQDDGTFTFRPEKIPNVVTEIYVTNEDGNHVTMWTADQLSRGAS